MMTASTCLRPRVPKLSKAAQWWTDCMERDNFECQAMRHDRRCRGGAQHAHHIVYRAHLVDAALWLTPNGISLSDHCHALAHATHNAIISEPRLIAAVDAVNAVQGEMPGQRVRYFMKKGIAS